MKGYIHIYTGGGKGKTTAALGLALRAAGAGFRIFIAQFLKQGDFSEIKALKQFSPAIEVAQFGLGRFVRGNPSKEDIAAGIKGAETIERILTEKKHDMLIIDEAIVATTFNLFPEKRLLSWLDQKPDAMELVITGRDASDALIEKADLVTEMIERKHYYTKGVLARVGIEK